MKTGQVTERLQKNGSVCVVDKELGKAVRIEKNGSSHQVFIKRKGHNEVRSKISVTGVQDIINDLGNQIVTRKDYDKF